MTFDIRPFLASLFQKLQGSFWLIPICMVIATLILAPLIVQLDLALADTSSNLLWPAFLLSVDGAREILSAIAGSMITVASLVFSMTLVALSLVTQQLGPRILQIFMEDRPTQIMLGLFIATFLFAMVMLGAVGIGRADDFIPRIGVTLAAILAVLAFGAVILFIHHIARNIQADVVIFNTAEKLQNATDALSREGSADKTEWVEKDRFHEILDELERNASTIKLGHRSGYVQYVNNETALNLATEHDLQIALRCRPGHFILRGRPILVASPASRVDDDLAVKLEAIVQIGPQRTRVQRVEFEMLALVEIALRALSKGINDPFTAISCIDRLSEGLAKLMQQHPDYRLVCGKDDTVRVLDYPQTFEQYLDRTCDPIRHSASDTPMVLERLEQMLEDLRSISQHAVQKAALDDQLVKVRAARRRWPDASD